MNIWDIVIIAAIVIAVSFAIRRIKKKGVCSCGGDCAKCAMRDECKDKK